MSELKCHGYKWPSYEGAYWQADEGTVGYLKYHDEERERWDFTPNDGEYPVVSGASAAELASRLEGYAERLRILARTVQSLEPEIPERAAVDPLLG